MEAATIPPETTDRDERLFRYSTWVHLGPGAEQCDDVSEATSRNDCSNPLHFHAWCRLPNQFQHRSIREKAAAAKARRSRLLRDPESDSGAILDDELDQIARHGDDAREPLIEELVGRDWWRDYMEAMKDVAEEEADDGSKPFEHIEDDQRRHGELRALPEDERGEEFAELERHLERYAARLEARHKEITDPKRQAFEGHDVNALIDLVRDQRIAQEGDDHFMHVYSTMQWFHGTLRHQDGPRRFESLEHMQEAAPEVIEALKATFDDLERTQNRGAAGNS